MTDAESGAHRPPSGRDAQLAQRFVALADTLGFLFLCVGDILFAYLPTIGRAGVDPLIHAMYILSYALTAYGVLHQYELLTS